MLDKVYERLRDTYSCTLSDNSDTKSIKVDVGFGFVLTITHKIRNGLNIFKVVSNRGSKPVYIGCPIDENGYSNIDPLYCFIDDFSGLL